MTLTNFRDNKDDNLNITGPFFEKDPVETVEPWIFGFGFHTLKVVLHYFQIYRQQLQSFNICQQWVWKLLGDRSCPTYPLSS